MQPRPLDHARPRIGLAPRCCHRAGLAYLILRGRSAVVSETVFTQVQLQLSYLVQQIRAGSLGLPDLQRPFVWESAKVRDLFDSMYRGYPVGYLLLWESGAEPGAKQIGTDGKQLAPSLLIVDGQQRLTSLFAVMTSTPVKGKDFRNRSIRIAFRPHDAFFSVANAATDSDPNFLNDISQIWTRPAYTVITEFLARSRNVDGDPEGDDDRIAEALNRLAGLQNYIFTALQLGASVPEEQVAEVFVRINSKGKSLNQADFILTLMSVFWDEGRADLERWSRECRTPGDPAWNSYLELDPDQLLRVAIALGFRRGRLEDAYTVLRGRDGRGGHVDTETRDAQFMKLASAQARVLDKAVWKEYLQALQRAGYRSGQTITSKNAILYSYALYLIGKHDFNVPLPALREVIARWFFMATLTSRYSSSPESRIHSDMAALPALSGAEGFIASLDEMIGKQLTPDFWSITLPNELATSAGYSPSLFGHVAALCVLDAPVLFSKMRCRELLDPSSSGGSTKVQRHHLFPKKFLSDIGVDDTKSVNQIANLALLEWHDNLSISAADPSHYWPAYLAAMRSPSPGSPTFNDSEIERMTHLHALPPDWPSMPYEDFLSERRKRMGTVVKEAFERLQHGSGDPVPGEAPAWPPSQAAIEHLLANGETDRVEFKSSLRADTLGRGVPAKVLEKVVARTVAAFCNQLGGMLVIGAQDDGTPLGLAPDLASITSRDLDGFQQSLVTVLANYLGADVAASVAIHIAILPDGAHIALVDCPAYSKPVYLTDGNDTEFHVRAGNTTQKFDVQETANYVADHWGPGDWTPPPGPS